MSIYETAPTGLALQEQKRRKHLTKVFTFQQMVGK
jgi:hypothetical protein